MAPHVKVVLFEVEFRSGTWGIRYRTRMSGLKRWMTPRSTWKPRLLRCAASGDRCNTLHARWMSFDVTWFTYFKKWNTTFQKWNTSF
jgi:hypothetical protein